MSTQTEKIEMTAEERAEFEAWRQAQEAKKAEERQREHRELYKKMVDQNINEVYDDLLRASAELYSAKKKVYDTFEAAIELKSELFNVKDEQRTHTFTNSEGTHRITLGNYTNDGYRDTVNEGIAIVKEVAESLIKDEKTKALVNAIMRLLSKDQKGNLKPSRVIQLRRLAEDLNNRRLMEGIRIIEEAYQPTVSKTFVRAEHKNKENEWVSVALGMTEVDYKVEKAEECDE
jgi:hypothetical protein